jgi:hypothetical protein
MNNREVPHAWAHGRKGRAGNLTTDGVSLWSYAMLIGERRMVGDQMVYFCSPEKRSVTTSAHQSLMRRAIPHGAMVVHSLARDPLPELIAAALDAGATLDRKRPGTNTHAYAQEALAKALEQVGQWCSLVGEPAPDLDTLRAQALAKAEEAKALRAADDARRLVVQKENLARWMAGEPVMANVYPPLPDGTWLRVKDDVVHTSGGLRFPLQACKDKLAAGVKVGDDVFGYRCLEVNDKRYVVGCHVMDRKHVEEVING